MNEIRIFFTALMFFTRIPCPPWVDHSEEYLNKSSRYFPLIGWIVGGIGAMTAFFGTFIVPTSIAILLSIIATILVTGAFHEDGFADMCDGFGGGWTKERILAIMQDSRLGTFGAVGLGLLLTLKFLCLVAIAEQHSVMLAVAILIAAHSVSRLTAISFLMTHEYSRAEGESKSKPLATRMTSGEFTLALLTGLAPMGLLWAWISWKILFFLAAVIIAKWHLGRFFTRWIGGYTGDCLGATQQVSEALVYLVLVIILRV